MNELYHHGIMGMKWGVRRYQNKDGTLTSEGRERYTNEKGNLNNQGLKYYSKLRKSDNKRIVKKGSSKGLASGYLKNFIDDDTIRELKRLETDKYEKHSKVVNTYDSYRGNSRHIDAIKLAKYDRSYKDAEKKYKDFLNNIGKELVKDTKLKYPKLTDDYINSKKKQKFNDILEDIKFIK